MRGVHCLLMPIETLERRVMLAAQPGIVADLRADTDRNGVIDARDEARKDGYNFVGPGSTGGIVLPNFNKNNTTTNAPDNWTGGNFNGRPVPPNNIIDNTADLADIARVRLAKLNTDASYEWRLVVRLERPKTDPAWFKTAAATDRVRVFMPTRQSGVDTLPQAGDVAVIGPGQGDTIVFCANPSAANEFAIGDIAGRGAFFFGVEGITPGANVRLVATLYYAPIGTDGPQPAPTLVNTDAVELKVAPFVLGDNRQRVTRAIVDDLTRYGLDNSAVQKTLKGVFGNKLVTSHSGDLWQQDGYEIGYVKAPYGSMPVVLELPRARNYFFSTTSNMRSLIRGTLLAAGVGVSLDVSGLSNDSSSGYGGDIESVAKPGSKVRGVLLMSNMPTALKDFFAAQGVNKAVDLPLNWLAVNHVDEVVQMTPGGKVIVADTDLAWALLVWANQLDANVRLHAGMNGNEYDPTTVDGIKASTLLADARLRLQNLEYAQRNTSLRGVVTVLKNALGLTEEVTSPVRTAGGSTLTLARSGVMTSLLGKAVRVFAVQFTSATEYRLRYRDGTSAWSKWFAGKTTRDEVFADAKAFILTNYWSGTAKAGDAFMFKTQPGATLLKMPVLFSATPVASDPSNPPMTPYSEDHVNSLVDGGTVITGRAYGPVVKWNRSQASDLFQDYATAAFKAGGYTNIVVTDARVYHNSSGSVHCATNAFRVVPVENWWLS